MLLFWSYLFPVISVNVLGTQTVCLWVNPVPRLTPEFPLRAESVLDTGRRAEQPGHH